MKTSTLRNIIKEEISKVLREEKDIYYNVEEIYIDSLKNTYPIDQFSVDKITIYYESLTPGAEFNFVEFVVYGKKVIINDYSKAMSIFRTIMDISKLFGPKLPKQYDRIPVNQFRDEIISQTENIRDIYIRGIS